MNKLERAKCAKSPTGAHWWMIPPIGAQPLGRCKFCGEEREFEGVYGAELWDRREQHERSMSQSIKFAATFGKYKDI